MKIKYIIIGLILPFTTLFAQTSFTVKGNIKEAKDNSLLTLSYIVDRSRIIDTLEVNNGSFSITNEIENPQIAKITYIHDTSTDTYADYLSIYLDNQPIVISVNDSIKNADVNGSDLSMEYHKYYKFIRSAEDEINIVSHKWNSLDEKGKDEFWFERSQRIRNAKELKKNLMVEYAKNNPDSYFSLSALIDLSIQDVDYPVVYPVFTNLSDDLRNSDRGVSLGKKIDLAGLSIIGAQAPDFTQNDLNGNPIKLSDFRGKYVLLDFWASWCAPCRAENPNLVKAYNKYKDKNFTILGVSLDNNKNAWSKAVDNDGLPWTHVCDLKGWENEVSKLYSVTAVPTSFLIDPNGIIIGKGLTGDYLIEFLEENL